MKLLALVFAPAFALAGSPPPAAAQAWEQVISDEGIEVLERDVPGTSFVAFRGRGRVDAPAIKIAAVLRDAKRRVEWMHNNSECFAVQLFSPGHMISYTRVASPAPFVSERDAVIEAKTRVLPEEKALRIDFFGVAHPKVPPREGVVRIPKISGAWILYPRGPNATDVVYEVQADPGGSLPSWIVNWASRKIPFHTIKNLRRQVLKPGYEHEMMIVSRAFDWSIIGVELAQDP